VNVDNFEEVGDAKSSKVALDTLSKMYGRA